VIGSFLSMEVLCGEQDDRMVSIIRDWGVAI
jgi:hypothetical protein